MSDLDQLRREARLQLQSNRPDLDPREATLLLAHCFDLSEAQVLSRGDFEPSARVEERFWCLFRHRLQGEPYAYLSGEREFYGRPYFVDSRVLIPRPETEHLVELALEIELEPTCAVLDLGTGSGCIAITIALERPGLSVLGADSSIAALAVAKRNRKRHAAPVDLVAADLVSGLDLSGVGLLVSNPPYIDPRESQALPIEVRNHEPATALYASPDGLGTYRKLLDPGLRVPAGTRLLLELGYGQLKAVRDLSATHYTVEQVRRDYAEIPRVIQLQRR